MSHLFWTKAVIFIFGTLTLWHSEQPKLRRVLAVLSAIGLSVNNDGVIIG